MRAGDHLADSMHQLRRHRWSCAAGLLATGLKHSLLLQKQQKIVGLSVTCIKNGAAMIPGLDYDRVNKLPGICGTSCNFTLTHDLDCSKVN
ncbi:Non-specific lipid-transfer protein [Melia azedarach]|uniref:Non-specific lipid-transfer protein n=1 Tax=Melia azedarach TaxID=155640 RepID=A0ACC1XQ79_MELAZ|nr:Non-specific lipid-transfer protein [Melia azedarach]